MHEILKQYVSPEVEAMIDSVANNPRTGNLDFDGMMNGGYIPSPNTKIEHFDIRIPDEVKAQGQEAVNNYISAATAGAIPDADVKLLSEEEYQQAEEKRRKKEEEAYEDYTRFCEEAYEDYMRFCNEAYEDYMQFCDDERDKTRQQNPQMNSQNTPNTNPNEQQPQSVYEYGIKHKLVPYTEPDFLGKVLDNTRPANPMPQQVTNNFYYNSAPTPQQMQQIPQYQYQQQYIPPQNPVFSYQPYYPQQDVHPNPQPQYTSQPQMNNMANNQAQLNGMFSYKPYYPQPQINTTPYQPQYGNTNFPTRPERNRSIEEIVYGTDRGYNYRYNGPQNIYQPGYYYQPNSMYGYGAANSRPDFTQVSLAGVDIFGNPIYGYKVPGTVNQPEYIAPYLLGSYGLPNQDQMLDRRVMMSPWYRPNMAPDPDYLSSWYNTTDHTPGRRYNPITGEGFIEDMIDDENFLKSIRNMDALIRNICNINPDAYSYFEKNTRNRVSFVTQLRTQITLCKQILWMCNYDEKSREEIEALEKSMFDPDPYPEVKEEENDNRYTADKQNYDYIPVWNATLDEKTKVITLTPETDPVKRRKRIEADKRKYCGRVNNYELMRFEQNKLMMRRQYEVIRNSAPERIFYGIGGAAYLYGDAFSEIGLMYKMAAIKAEHRRDIRKVYNPDGFMNYLRDNTDYNFNTERETHIGRIYGSYGVMPDGRPVSPGNNPNIAKSFSYDPQSGQMFLTCPENFDDFKTDEEIDRENREALAQTTVVPPNFVARFKDRAKDEFYRSLHSNDLPL